MNSAHVDGEMEKIKQIIFASKDYAQFPDVENRKLDVRGLRIQIRYSGVNAGTERVVLTGKREKKILRPDSRQKTGYTGNLWLVQAC